MGDDDEGIGSCAATNDSESRSFFRSSNANEIFRARSRPIELDRGSPGFLGLAPGAAEGGGMDVERERGVRSERGVWSRLGRRGAFEMETEQLHVNLCGRKGNSRHRATHSQGLGLQVVWESSGAPSFVQEKMVSTPNTGHIRKTESPAPLDLIAQRAPERWRQVVARQLWEGVAREDGRRGSEQEQETGSQGPPG